MQWLSAAAIIIGAIIGTALSGACCYCLRSGLPRRRHRRLADEGRLISDLDIYPAAKLLIERHGADALIEAGRMIDRMLDDGDTEGRLFWRRIKVAIEAQQAPPSGATHTTKIPSLLWWSSQRKRPAPAYRPAQKPPLGLPCPGASVFTDCQAYRVPQKPMLGSR
jgi:hypothetical protein